jgi:hypothetical protein
MKTVAIIVGIIIVLVIVYFAAIAPLMHAAGERKALQSIMSAKSDIPSGANVTPEQVGEWKITAEVPPKAPLSIDIADATVTYAGPESTVRLYYARTTEWGRQPVDHPGVMQSTSRALADYAAGQLQRLDVPGHPIVCAELKGGGWCACWMNLDNLFCVVAQDRKTMTQFVSTYPF